jgi:hypothetical protein
MPLNDDNDDEFDSKIEDESTYPLDADGVTEVDRGSGSYAEDGPIELAEDRLEFDGEMNTHVGSAAMYGPSEIGAQADVMMPFESFMLEEPRIGAVGDMLQQYEIGAAAAADRDGAEIGAAIVKVVETARDNRQPAPVMRAVDVEAPPLDDDDWGLTDVVIGAAVVEGNGADQFPLTTALMQRCGAGMAPRLVRIDTEDSYRQFRTENSPELTELSARADELERRLNGHMIDPSAHDALADDIADLTEIGAQAESVEAEKRVELWLPKRYDGLVTAWRDGEYVCASLALPGSDGEIRVCTSMEPVRKCVAEMAKHASEAGVPAATVVGVLPAMGCVLGAGTVLKEMAAAAPAILARPEADAAVPFVVRIEPKANPALCALAMLAMACRAGSEQACDEWKRLGQKSAGPVRQAMTEALSAAKAVG